MNIKKKKKTKAEKDIQKEILEWLTKSGFLCWRNNNVGLFDAYSGKFRRKGKYQMLGIPDIFAVIDGRFIAIEVKSQTGRVSVYQQQFIDKVKENGGIAFVARCLEDVEKELFLL